MFQKGASPSAGPPPGRASTAGAPGKARPKSVLSSSSPPVPPLPFWEKRTECAGLGAHCAPPPLRLLLCSAPRRGRITWNAPRSARTARVPPDPCSATSRPVRGPAHSLRPCVYFQCVCVCVCTGWAPNTSTSAVWVPQTTLVTEQPATAASCEAGALACVGRG
eukprot:gene15270-biopygen6657